MFVFASASQPNGPAPPAFKLDPGIIEKFNLCQSADEAQNLWWEIGKDEHYKSLYAKTYSKLKD